MSPSLPASTQPALSDDIKPPPQPRSFAVSLDTLPLNARGKVPEWTRGCLAGPDRAPLLVVLGGISANATVAYGPQGQAGWWQSLFGLGAPLGTDKYRVLGIDFAADDGGDYAPDTKEQASIIADTLSGLDEQPLAIIGASYGGMVALAFAERFKLDTSLVIISASARPHPMSSAMRGLQRQVVALGLAHECGSQALAIARGMAMLTYRTRKEFGGRFAGGIPSGDPSAASEPCSYLKARGSAFAGAMTPGRFLSLSASIDRHSIAPEAIRCPALVIGVEEDTLVPVEDVASLAAQLGGPTQYRVIHSVYGHDAFLKEPEMLGSLIRPFLEEARTKCTAPKFEAAKP
ncbi:MAG TPA: alpha/beta fold hydrolase [Sphingomicrobium sp.]|nr:alpha/beta fold hydrolase [Sphingomicrobium sp.]